MKRIVMWLIFSAAMCPKTAHANDLSLSEWRGLTYFCGVVAIVLFVLWRTTKTEAKDLQLYIIGSKTRFKIFNGRDPTTRLSINADSRLFAAKWRTSKP